MNQNKERRKIMTQQRKPYLVTKSLRNYLFAAILSMAVGNINLLIDGILMGQFLGPDELAAINLSLPVVNSIHALSILLSVGGVMIAARALGKMNRKRLYEVFTISIFAVLTVGLLILIFSKPLSGFTAHLITSDKSLVSLCEKYVYILMLGGIPIMCTDVLSAYLNVTGHPKVVTVGTCMSVFVNISMDVLLVKVFRMDIGGSALATVLGNIARLVFFVLFILRKKDLLKFTFRISNPFRDLGEIISKSIAETVAVFAVVALQVICSGFVQASLGAPGMFVLSIGYSILGLSLMASDGMSTTFTAIGGNMMGQKDYQGLRFLFRRGILICFLAGLMFFFVGLLFPGPLATLFGADTEALKELSSRGIPFITTFILALTVMTPVSTHLQVLGHFALSTAANIMQLVSIFVSCLLVGKLLPPEDIWYAFPLACALCLLSTFVLCIIGKLFSRIPVNFPSLIPVDDPESKHFELSVACTEDALHEATEELWMYLDDNSFGKLSPRVAHSVEELLVNTIQHSGDATHYIDILIGADSNELTVLLKDDGAPFDTSSCPSAKKKNGLKIAHHYCGSISYSYTFGQNMTLMTWPLKQ